MSEPLIVVEGELRLPTVRPLPDPALDFGVAWTLARARPVQSPFEIALYAARFKTAYLPAFRLSDSTSRYRAVSLWSVFAHGELPRAILDLLDSHRARTRAEEAPVDPLRLSAPIHAGLGAARRGMSRIAQILTGVAISVGALLLLWLLFGNEPAAPNVQPAAPFTEAARSGPTEKPPIPSAHAPPAAVVAAVAAPARSIEPEAPAEVSARLPQDPAAAVPRRTAVAREADRTRAITVSRSRHERTEAQRKTARVKSARTGAMNVHSLYALLQHSPTLDSNAPAPDAPDARDAGDGGAAAD
ncbi:hypothetical protein [Caballeronia sp. LZ034LL]|uniref:hypothetical protein n=1 Tax=Caballeronia sp. LZ034LL TaxID=3038567 RepID=UPI00285A2BAB|nr:hypothetical protein [Caballeronia sp. LZ034LL]MDR5834589.1 hypothetical protein [Caballeronia sp. LZ034LL]